MLEQKIKEYQAWLKLGEIMARRPVAYFTSENAKGEYPSWLRTKAWFETQIANLMEMEQTDGVERII